MIWALVILSAPFALAVASVLGWIEDAPDRAERERLDYARRKAWRAGTSHRAWARMRRTNARYRGPTVTVKIGFPRLNPKTIRPPKGPTAVTFAASVPCKTCKGRGACWCRDCPPPRMILD